MSIVNSIFLRAPVSLSILIGVYIACVVIYFIESCCVKYLFASMIDACNASNNFLFNSSVISNKIVSHISLSEISPSALKTINNGIGCFTRGN